MSTDSKALPSEHLEEIGKVVVGFQDLEVSITCAMLALMSTQSSVKTELFNHLVINELSFTSRLKLLSLFIEIYTQKVIDAEELSSTQKEEWENEVLLLRKGVNLAKHAQEQRNQIIHSYWLDAPVVTPINTVVRTKLKTKEKHVKSTWEYLAIEDIEKISNMAAEAANLIQPAARHLSYIVQDLDDFKQINQRL